jgi:hypothetical protein
VSKDGRNLSVNPGIAIVAFLSFPAINYMDDLALLDFGIRPVTIPYACGGGAGSCTILDSTAENSAARVPYLVMNSAKFEDLSPNSDSHYNALQATLGRHISRGLYFQGAYTYSKSIDDVSTASVAFVTRVNDQLNPRASEVFRISIAVNALLASAVYDLPTLGEFEVSEIGARRLSNCVNPGAYTSDPFGPLSTGGNSDATIYGNTPRNCMIAFPQKNVDLTLEKIFKIGERQHLHLRFQTDFFNLFNDPSFANPPSAEVAAPGPGLAAVGSAPITSVVGTPCLFQFSLKYWF